MKTFNVFVAIILFLAIWISLPGFSATYEVKAYGLKLARLFFTSCPEDGFTEVKVESSVTKYVSTEINNLYRSHYNEEFLTQNYTRVIRQGQDSDDIEVAYDRQDLFATAQHSGIKGRYNYPITQDLRDLFTLLSYVASGKVDSGDYTVDGNGCLWSIGICKDGWERISNSLGKFSCIRYMILVKPLFAGDMPYVDKITQLLLNESHKLILWISQDGIPVKATFKSGIFSSVCELISLES